MLWLLALVALTIKYASSLTDCIFADIVPIPVYIRPCSILKEGDSMTGCLSKPAKREVLLNAN
jgi:hypothetical protein